MAPSHNLAMTLAGVAVALASANARADDTAPVPVPPPVVVTEAAREVAEASCAPGWESRVFSKARGSVVRISSDDRSWGAGFVWKTPRTLVTAMHVVEGGRSFAIEFADGSTGRARLVAGDRVSDVAFLELEGAAPLLTPLELGDPILLPLGAPVIAIGHPLILETTGDLREEGLRAWTVTRGVLGARNAEQIQVDAALNPGNSGGPILDCEGRVIGVASHVARSLGFASAPKEILDLDRDRKLPGLSFVPTGRGLHLGVSMRWSGFTSVGPLLELKVTFFDKIDLALRATGLLNLANTVEGDRIITSRVGVGLYGGMGYRFWFTRPLHLIPQLGVTSFQLQENAFSMASGTPREADSGHSALRFTPGLAVSLFGAFALEYKLELDVGTPGDSAHVFSIVF